MDYTIDLENEPTLEEDMARFPDKTKDEARQARNLWALGLVYIIKSEWQAEYICRKAICVASPFLRTQFPSARSWPIVEWDSIFEEQSIAVQQILWRVFSSYLFSIYAMKAPADCYMEHIALFAEATHDAKLFNASMSDLCDGVGDVLSTASERQLLNRTLNTERLALQTVQEKYNSQRLIRYLVDKIVWDQIRSRPIKKPEVVDHKVQQFLDLQVANLLDNPQEVAPWEPQNRWKYLMPEPSVVKFIKAEPDEPVLGLKRELSPDNNPPSKRARTVDDEEEPEIPGGLDILVKEETFVKEVSHIKKEEELIPSFQKAIDEKEVEVLEVVKANVKFPEAGKTPNKKEEQHKLETKHYKGEVVDVEAEPKVQVFRVRRVKTQVRRDIYDLN